MTKMQVFLLYIIKVNICTAKPDIISKKKYAKADVLDCNLCSIPKEMKIDLIGYYLATDKWRKLGKFLK